MNRHEFLSTTIMAGASLAVPGFLQAKTEGDNKRNNSAMKVCIFSKQLQWLNYSDMAKAVSDMGYDGIDLTVRSNGHVLPVNVEMDLPKAVEAAEKAGVKILMISTDIKDADDPLSISIIKTAAKCNIHFYRTSGLNYIKDSTITSTLEKIRSQYSAIVDLNKKYGLYSSYLNHSGEGFGSSLWDLWYTIKDLDPRFIGSQFDIKHASISGTYCWPVNFKLLHEYIQTMVVRDFKWEPNNGVFEIKPMPLGEGIVDFKKYFSLVKDYNIAGPICVMCDYELGGAENGASTLSIPGKNVLNAMSKDLQTLKNNLKSAGIIS